MTFEEYAALWVKEQFHHIPGQDEEPTPENVVKQIIESCVIKIRPILIGYNIQKQLTELDRELNRFKERVRSINEEKP